MSDPEDADDIEQARVRARVRKGLFGGDAKPVRIDRFEIAGRLGAGAMGVVYEARDTELDRTVALKLLHPDLQSGAAARPTQLLLEEARAMARVRHPNVVTVHQVGTHGGHVYVAMERMRGTLREWLARDRPAPERVLATLIATGQGLAAVHRQGLVHRDFKLDNVLMDEHGQPKVSDFGLVARRDGGSVAGGAGAGTPAYMAPEQLRGDSVDARSDQWSFCVTAVEALTGRRPFAAETREALLEAAVTHPRAEALAGVPSRVAEVLRRGLEPEASARFPSMDALLVHLEQAREPARARWLAIGAGVLAAGALAAAVGLARSEGTRASAPAASSPAPPPSPSAAAPVENVTRLCKRAVRASSERAEHPAAHAFDGIPATAWTEADPGDGAGSWLEIELRPGTWVSAVEVGGGWSATTASGLDLWAHNTTFRRMRVSWDGGERELTFDRATDRGKRKRISIEAPLRTLRITALEVDRGRWRDLCLDEVEIWGHCPR